MGLFDRIRSDDGPRVAFIGIDGVPYDLIAENEDEFEHLTAIAETGDGNEIKSIVPPESSACWPALTTGMNPGCTGVYGFQDREIGSYETYVPMGRDVQAKRLWTRVQEAGKQATVLNVPVTFPPDRNVQRMISGFLSPGVERAAYPDSLRPYLEEIGYRIDVDAKLGHKEDKSEFIADANETLDRRHEAFTHFIETGDWELFFGVYMTTDRVNHFLFKDYETEGDYYEEFMDFYRKLDDYIGEIRALVPDNTTLIVASDHGFTTLEYEVHCNEWLQQNGWLSYKTDNPEALGDIADDTRAYSLIPGRFYLNLDGREPRGTVPEEEYEATIAELEEDLTALTGPEGEPVIKRVERRVDAFRGDHTAIAPDLVAIPHDGFDLKSGFNNTGEVFGTGPRNGMHTFDNACLFIDNEQAKIKDADLYDIAPTIMQLLDVDYQRGTFDGATLVK